MTDPQNTGYQSDAWQPTVYTGDEDSGDAKKAAQAYDDIYGGTYLTDPGKAPEADPPDTTTYVVPGVHMAYTTAPDLIPELNSAGKSAKTPLTGGTFNVDLGALRTAEQSCLDAVSAATDDYLALSKMVSQSIDSANAYQQQPPNSDDTAFGPDIWGEQLLSNPASSYQLESGNGSDQNNNSFQQFYTTPPGADNDPLDGEGAAFAASINPQQRKLLQAVAGSLQTMGVFTALLNNAGQMYANADLNSAFLD